MLRPKTEADCKCRTDNNCGERSCGYKWKFPDTDPCNDKADACFYPGTDPYSFIATVALPAWPKRFRTAEGRLMMENIMYRTAPAHVLLRILWLTPYDFCRFESKYKKWHAMLAQQKNCIANFDNCEMLEFVFDQQFNCLNECTDCLPCKDDTTTQAGCFDNDITDNGANNFVNEINELYCFQTINCADNRIKESRDTNVEKLTGLKNEPLLIKNITILKNESAVLKPATVKKIGKIEKEKPLGDNTLIPLSSFVNSRIAFYKNAVEVVKIAVQNNSIAVKAERFLKTQSPTEAQIETIVTEIIQNKKPTDNNGITINKSRKYILLENIVCYALDKAFFNGNGLAQIKILLPVFTKIENAGFEMNTIYERWNSKEVKKYLPEINIIEIKKTITGTARK